MRAAKTTPGIFVPPTDTDDLPSFTVSFKSADQTFEAAGGCVDANGRSGLPRSAANADSSYGGFALADDASVGGSTNAPASPGLAEPSTPVSTFFPRLVSFVRNQVANSDSV